MIPRAASHHRRDCERRDQHLEVAGATRCGKGLVHDRGRLLHVATLQEHQGFLRSRRDRHVAPSGQLDERCHLFGPVQ